MKCLKILEISAIRFLYFLLKIRYNTRPGDKQLLLIVWNTECIVLLRCTKSVLFNKYVLLCRYRLIKKWGASVSLHSTPNQKNIVCFCKTATKKQNNFWLRLKILLRHHLSESEKICAPSVWMRWGSGAIPLNLDRTNKSVIIYCICYQFNNYRKLPCVWRVIGAGFHAPSALKFR